MQETYPDDFRNPDNTRRDISLVQYTYDPAGDLSTEVRGNGKTKLAYTVDAAGRTAKTVLDPDGSNRSVVLSYNANDDVTKQVYSGGGITEHSYDALGRPTGTTVRNGSAPALVTTFNRDQRGLVTKQIDARGNAAGANPADFTTEYQYDAAGRTVEAKLPPVEVEKNGGSAAVTRPTSRTGYDTHGNPVKTQNATGGIATSTYDKLNRLTRHIAPAYLPPGADTALTPTTNIAYDAAGRVERFTDPRGRETRFTYDVLGRLVRRSDPSVGGADVQWRYTYDLAGESLSATDPTGAQVQATYDDLGRRITATQVERRPAAANFVTAMAYDDAGNLTSTTSPTGATTTTAYNTAGEPTKTTDPLGNASTYIHDDAGRVSRVTNPMGLAQSFTYDLAGRRTAVTDIAANGASLRSRSYTYDVASDIVSATDPSGRTTTYAHDALGRLTQQVEPISDSTSITTNFGYDEAGNNTRFTDGRGNKTIYTYNTLGLPESTIEPATSSHPAAADRTYTAAYDAAGQASTVTQPGGVVTRRTMDELGRVTRETGEGTEAPTSARQFAYDLAGRIISASAPSGSNIYTYNDRGLLLTAGGPSGDATFTYDAEGRLTNRVDAAGAATFSYNGAHQLTSANDPATGTTIGYQYDKAGAPTQISHGTTSKRDFTYDDLHRLTGDTLRNPSGAAQATITYGYDLNSRLTSKTTTGLAGAGTNTYAYDHAGRLTKWTGNNTTTDYGWDAAGNRTTNGGKTAAYDQRNRLLNDGDSNYTYTPRGTLATKTTGTTTTSLAFDAFDRLTSDGAKTYTYDELGRLHSRGSTNFTYADLTNNPVSDEQATYSRDPFGARPRHRGRRERGAGLPRPARRPRRYRQPEQCRRVRLNRDFNPFGERTGTNGEQRRIGYQGGWTDPDTGKVNAAARWYDPANGTFASRDTWWIPAHPSVAANRYTYGNADPLNLADPSGHSSICTGMFGWLLDESSIICGPKGDSHGTDTLSAGPGMNAAHPGLGWRDPKGSTGEGRGHNSGGSGYGSGGAGPGGRSGGNGPTAAQLRAAAVHRAANTKAARPASIFADVDDTAGNPKKINLPHPQGSGDSDEPMPWLDKVFYNEGSAVQDPSQATINLNIFEQTARVLGDLIGVNDAYTCGRGAWAFREVGNNSDVDDACFWAFVSASTANLGRLFKPATKAAAKWAAEQAAKKAAREAAKEAGEKLARSSANGALNLPKRTPTTGGKPDTPAPRKPQPTGTRPAERGAGNDYAKSVIEAPGRPDGDVVFAGHGVYRYGSGDTVIPEGTTLNVYSPHGGSIRDSVGLAIEQGRSPAPVMYSSQGTLCPTTACLHLTAWSSWVHRLRRSRHPPQ